MVMDGERAMPKMSLERQQQGGTKSRMTHDASSYSLRWIQRS